MSFRVTSALTFAAVVVVSAGVLAGGGAAHADQVWYQGYERTSSTEVCTAQPGETPWQASWGPDASWHPSWEMWANGGRGGWTCGRAITWARDPVAAGAAASTSYTIGDIGPGGGIVFYKDLTQPAGKQYMEAASADLGSTMAWCSDTTNSVSTATAIGTGAANTTSMLTSAAPFVACTSGAGFSARAYTVGGLNDWFLPSKDELNQLCKYARGQSTAVADQATECDATGTLKAGFSADFYWSSSNVWTTTVWFRTFDTGLSFGNAEKSTSRFVRPVRAF